MRGELSSIVVIRVGIDFNEGTGRKASNLLLGRGRQGFDI